jgi:hypothetical protein
MEKRILFYLLIISIFLLHSCGSIVPQQPQITAETPLDIPNTRGIVSIPLEIDLEPYFYQADKSIPKTFRGNEEQCDGISFKYYFTREPLEFKGLYRKMSYHINGQYNIRANYCAQCSSIFGSDPFCLTPRIYVSCGVGEPLRKIGIDFESELSISSNYILKSTTQLMGVKTVDPCELSFFHYDASKLIEDEMSEYLKEMERVIDDQIENIDLKTPIDEAWSAMQKVISVPNLGYLYFQPRAIGIEPIIFDQLKANVIINIELSPVFSSDTIVSLKQSLPFLSKISSKETFNLPLLTLVSFDSINAILKKEVLGTTIPFKKKLISITEAIALGPVGTQLLFKVKFIGSKKGTIYLLGTPTYNSKNQEISFPDLTFDIRSRDAILKSAKWLFDKRLTELFRSKAKYNLSNQIEKARLEIDKQLNTSIEFKKNQYIHLSGNLEKLNFYNLHIGPKELRVIIDLEGNLSLKL